MVANLGVKATAEPTVTPHQRPPAGGSGSPDAQATTIAKQHPTLKIASAVSCVALFTLQTHQSDDGEP
jgi:hypothetical protein